MATAGVIFGMRNSCQDKQHPWSRTGALFPALLSGNQSQFNFETLITMETNYERQDLKPLIKVGANKAMRVSLGQHWQGGGI